MFTQTVTTLKENIRIVILGILVAAVSAFGAVPKGVDLASLKGWDIVRLSVVVKRP